MENELHLNIIEETREEALKRIGRTAIITDASSTGKAGTIPVVYNVENYKAGERVAATDQAPQDENALGRQYEDLDKKGV